MFGLFGKSKVSIKNTLTTGLSNSIITTLSQKCGSKIDSDQSIDIVASGSTVKNVDVDSNIVLQQGCKVDEQTLNKAIQETSAKMAAEFKKDSTVFSDAIQLLKGKSDKDVSNKISQTINNKISTDMINSCLASIESKQKIRIVAIDGALVSGIHAGLTANLMSSCLMKQLTDNGLVQQLSADQQAKSTETDTTLTGLAELTKSFFSGLSGLLYGWMYYAVLFIIVIAVVVYFITKTK